MTRKAAPSGFGGRVIGLEEVIREGTAREDGYAILFEADQAARRVGWRGADHSMAWWSGPVEPTLDHERG